MHLAGCPPAGAPPGEAGKRPSSGQGPYASPALFPFRPRPGPESRGPKAPSRSSPRRRFPRVFSPASGRAFSSLFCRLSSGGRSQRLSPDARANEKTRADPTAIAFFPPAAALQRRAKPKAVPHAGQTPTDRADNAAAAFPSPAACHQPEPRRTGARTAAAGAVPPVARRAFTSPRLGAQKSGTRQKRDESRGHSILPGRASPRPPGRCRKSPGNKAAARPHPPLPAGGDAADGLCSRREQTAAASARGCAGRFGPALFRRHPLPPQAGAANVPVRPFPAAGAGAPGGAQSRPPFSSIVRV